MLRFGCELRGVLLLAQALGLPAHSDDVERCHYLQSAMCKPRTGGGGAQHVLVRPVNRLPVVADSIFWKGVMSGIAPPLPSIPSCLGGSTLRRPNSFV